MADKDPNAIEYTESQLAEHEKREKKAKAANKDRNPRGTAPKDETPEVAAPPPPPAPEKETKKRR